MSPVVALAQSVALETSAAERMFSYGAIGVLCVVFAFVIRALYKQGVDERKAAAESDKKHVAELVSCEERCRTEKEAVRTESERRHRELVEAYAQQIRQIRDLSEKREDNIRLEAASMIAQLADANTEANDKLVAMLQQFIIKVVK